MTADPPAVLVRDLARSYGRRRVKAVDGVSFAIARGEIFGLIGPDGAGKTSVIQMIAGVLAPHDGAVTVAGVDVVRRPEAVKPLVGYMPQGLGANLYDSLTVSEHIEFFRDLRGIPRAEYAANRDELLRMTRLGAFLGRRAGNLSGGMRQKLALICALIHLPTVLLLDEPTTGVDPISRRDFWRIITRVVQVRQATVLLSTSYMDEAERCHRIALLHSGRIVAEGSPESIKGRATGRRAAMIVQPQTTAIAALRARPDVLGAEVFGDVIHLHYDGDLRRIERGVVAAGATISDSAIREPSLEDVFLELVGQADRRSAPTMMIRGSSTPGPAGNALSCRQVSRTFGAFRAVDDVTFDVCGGEIFGLLGPNGAGKTTLIKMLCGLLPISQGKVTLAGADVAVARAGIWRHVGYMSQKFSLYRDLTVRQNLALYADLYDVPHERCHQVLGRLNLDQWSTRLVRDLPTGLRQRLSLLCAVLHDPSVVFLDEPTSGVDPEARRLFWDLIYSLSREAGVTVVVSTHYMDEAEHCDRLALMHSGRLVALDSPRALRATAVAATGELLVVRCGDATAAWNAVTRVAPHAVAYGDGIHVRTHSAAATRAALAAALTAAGVGGTVRIDGAPLSMDETFVDFIEEAERQHA